MRPSVPEKSWGPWLMLILYSAFFLSLFCSWRAVSSISVGLMLLAALVIHTVSPIKITLTRSQLFFISAGILYLVLVLAFSFFESDLPFSSVDLQLKSGILLIPIALIVSWPVIKERRSQLFTVYCILLLGASVYCLLTCSYPFYHHLVSPLHQHAVYFSIYCLLAIFFLQRPWIKSCINDARIRNGLSVYFSLFLLLLSSKIVLVFLAIYWLHFFLSSHQAYSILAVSLLVIITGVVLITNNPVGKRFRDSISGDPLLAEKDKFDPGVYFNGPQFRLLQWKLVPRILHRKDAWLTGVGPQKAQASLDEEYIQKNMYVGEPGKDGLGYRAYNCHNQLLESLLRYGIPGMLCFLFLLILLVYLALTMRDFAGRLIIFLLLSYSLVESVLETQYGIILFAGLPILIEMAENSQPRAVFKRL